MSDDDEFRDFEAVKETIRQNEARDPDFYAPPDAFTEEEQQAKMPPRSLQEALARGMTPHEYALNHSDEHAPIAFTEDDVDLVSDIVHSIGIPAYYFGSDGKVKDEYARLVADRAAAIEHYRDVVAGTPEENRRAAY